MSRLQSYVRKIAVFLDRLSPSHFGLLLTSFAVVFLLLMVTYPAIYLFWISLHKFTLVSSHFVGFTNFIQLFHNPAFWSDLRRSLIYAFSSSAIFFPVGLILALALHRVHRFVSFFRVIVLLSWMIPPAIAAMLWRWACNSQLGIVNSVLKRVGIIDKGIVWLGSPTLAMLVLIFVDAWIRIPFIALLELARLKTIPRYLYDAASIDGATPFQKFRFVTFPNLRGITALALGVQTMFAFRIFAIVNIITGGGPGRATELLPNLIYRLAFLRNQLGYAGAASIIMFLFCGLFILGYFKLLGKEY